MIEPRIRSVPPCESSLGREAVDLAASAGVFLDDWQALVLEQSLGLRGDGKWSSFEVAVNVARQNGKNEIALARELAGLFLLGEKLVIHSAHEFKTSTEHQRRVEEVIRDTPELHRRVKPRGYKHSHGEESIELRSGQRIRFMTRTKGGGRGHTGDLVVLDEAMILPAAMVGALMPTLSARSVLGNPQLWYCFTAVDQLIHEHGVVVARLRERALKGGDPSLAYFEWSVDGDNPEAAGRSEGASDPAVWAVANPALGIRISEEHVANEQRSMDPRTFAVERLGVGDWPATSLEAQQPIPIAVWRALTDADPARARLADPVCFAFDVPPDRSYTAVAAAGTRGDGLLGVEVVEHRRGTGWAADRIVELVGKHRPVAVVCDAAGPAASLLPDLQYAGLEVTTLSARDHAAACGLLADSVAEGSVRHLGTPELEMALRGAVKRPLGDAWAWSRRHSAPDISPLVACTLALYGFASREVPAPPPMVAFG